MKTLPFLLLGLACCAGCTRGRQDWSAPTSWAESGTEALFAEMESATLPAGLRTELTRWAEFTQGGTQEIPATLRVCRIDLNADGADDFVIKSNEPYSGGPMMEIFVARGERYIEIGSTQGMLRFEKPVGGYLVLDSMSAGGGGGYTRTLQTFRENKYRLVRIANYRWDQDESDRFVFVEERDPRPYQH
jgi:hypothetical protein